VLSSIWKMYTGAALLRGRMRSPFLNLQQLCITDDSEQEQTPWSGAHRRAPLAINCVEVVEGSGVVTGNFDNRGNLDCCSLYRWLQESPLAGTPVPVPAGYWSYRRYR
jgi:hypothetical protein